MGDTIELTPREQDVLALMDHSNREIVLLLGISHQHVKNIWSSIYKKWGIDGQKKGKRVRVTVDYCRPGGGSSHTPDIA